MKPLLAVAALALLAPLAHSDTGDVLISVCGSFSTAQGENFSVNYEADMTSYDLVPGTLNYSASGPMGPLTLLQSIFPEGAAWQDAAGDVINLMLFRTPGCPETECQPEVGLYRTVMCAFR